MRALRPLVALPRHNKDGKNGSGIRPWQNVNGMMSQPGAKRFQTRHKMPRLQCTLLNKLERSCWMKLEWPEIAVNYLNEEKLECKDRLCIADGILPEGIQRNRRDHVHRS